MGLEMSWFEEVVRRGCLGSGGNLSGLWQWKESDGTRRACGKAHSIGPIACMGWNFCCQENNLWYQPCCCTRRSMQISIYTPRTHNGSHHAVIWQAVYPSSFPWAEIPILFASGGRLRNPGVWICDTDWLSSSSDYSPRGSTP